MKPALFLDRDGTVCREVGYVNHPERLELLPRSAEAILLAREAGFLCILITNQSGVARGYFPESRIHETHARLVQMLDREGTCLDGLYYCPHHPQAGEPPYRRDCDCRKPRPGMIRQAIRDLHVEMTESLVIGDKMSDVETGHAVDIPGILVRTGYGRGEEEYDRSRWSTQPDYIADDLHGAVKWAVVRRGGTP
ncbi:MAG: D-glycero-alpha-D-manno-heptose-1,7-bisphosphate 7-phosphatase [Acidobacteriota bacterium]